MEAASARYAGGYASRDRYWGLGDAPASTLQRYIYNACDPQNLEPNLALNLEVADLVNSKKGNAPREAAMAIVHLINSRNPNISILALAVLDICVKNCGYPFHLQISTKEFLNELVRRFPERPPLRPSRVQARVLESIEEWRSTICQTSRYKEDLGFIRDMHTLLRNKGYMFPAIRKEDAAVLNPSDNLQSVEEMEEEERTAQSAKLQELIRRGGPEDLQEANRLMKVMAGYDTRHKTDYRAKAAEEVAKVQQKAKILEEMLQSHKPGDKVGDGDVFEELASALQSAHPKIQKMCEEESEDAEAVSKLLEINDSIHRTVERYKLIKKGDVEGASRIPQGTLGTRTGVGKNAANELSLIDFDPEPTAQMTSAAGDAGSKSTSTEDDLLGLSIGDRSSDPGGGIALGFGANTAIPGLMSSSFQQNSTPSTVTSASSPAPLRPDYNAFQVPARSTPPPQSGSPFPFPQEQQPRSSSVDPFASLMASSIRSSSPSTHSQAQKQAPNTSSLFDLEEPSIPPQKTVATDEDWDFASALPESSLPPKNTLEVLASSLRIVFVATRPVGKQTTISISAQFSNNTNQRIDGLHFQVAVEKGYSLQLKPQSGREMGPKQQDGIQQNVIIDGIPNGKGSTVKMRYKVSYQVDGQPREERGDVPSLGIA